MVNRAEAGGFVFHGKCFTEDQINVRLRCIEGVRIRPIGDLGIINLIAFRIMEALSELRFVWYFRTRSEAAEFMNSLRVHSLLDEQDPFFVREYDAASRKLHAIWNEYNYTELDWHVRQFTFDDLQLDSNDLFQWVYIGGTVFELDRNNQRYVYCRNPVFELGQTVHFIDRKTLARPSQVRSGTVARNACSSVQREQYQQSTGVNSHGKADPLPVGVRFQKIPKCHGRPARARAVNCKQNPSERGSQSVSNPVTGSRPARLVSKARDLGRGHHQD